MERFTWNEEYSVGVDLFDEQHQNFFNIVNEIMDAYETPEIEVANCLELLTKLGNYTVYHLSSEEEYFEKFGYEDAAAHIRQHNEFRETVIGMIKDIRNAENVDKKQILNIAAFASSWLLEHILVTDKNYTKFFNKHPIV